METITLVKETILTFSGVDQTTEQGFIVRRSSTDLRVELPQQFSSTLFGSHGHKNESLEVKIMLPELIPDGEDAMGSMQIEADEENHVLEEMLSLHSPNDVTVTWEVTHFGPQGTELDERTSWTAEGIEVIATRRFKRGSNGNPSHPRAYLCLENIQDIPASFIAAWRDGKTFDGFFSVNITIPKTPFSYIVSIENEHFSNGRKMLINEANTDLELISCDYGTSVKCHRAVLWVSSEKLARLLDRQRGRKRVDFMSHLSRESIKAILAYMYYKDVSSFKSSVALAIQVLEAATEFGLLGLTFHVQLYLTKKPADEFSPGESVKCFVVCKKMGLHENEAEVSNSNEGDYGNSDNENGTEGTGHETAGESENTDGGNISEISRNRRGVKRINEDTDVQLKRNFVGNKEPRVFNDDAVVAGCSSSLLILNGSGNGSVESDSESQNNEAAIVNQHEDPNVIKMDDVFKYWDLLEKHAIDVIVWHLKNNQKELLESFEYLQLVKTPLLLMQITNIFATSNE